MEQLKKPEMIMSGISLGVSVVGVGYALNCIKNINAEIEKFKEDIKSLQEKNNSFLKTTESWVKMMDLTKKNNSLHAAHSQQLVSLQGNIDMLAANMVESLNIQNRLIQTLCPNPDDAQKKLVKTHNKIMKGIRKKYHIEEDSSSDDESDDSDSSSDSDSESKKKNSKKKKDDKKKKKKKKNNKKKGKHVKILEPPKRLVDNFPNTELGNVSPDNTDPISILGSR